MQRRNPRERQGREEMWFVLHFHSNLIEEDWDLIVIPKFLANSNSIFVELKLRFICYFSNSFAKCQEFMEHPNWYMLNSFTWMRLNSHIKCKYLRLQYICMCRLYVCIYVCLLVLFIVNFSA